VLKCAKICKQNKIQRVDTRANTMDKLL
jgi:hypothetical protein